MTYRVQYLAHDGRWMPAAKCTTRDTANRNFKLFVETTYRKVRLVRDIGTTHKIVRYGKRFNPYTDVPKYMRKA